MSEWWFNAVSSTGAIFTARRHWETSIISTERHRETSTVYKYSMNTRLGEAAKQSPNSVTVVWTRCLSL